MVVSVVSVVYMYILFVSVVYMYILLVSVVYMYILLVSVVYMYILLVSLVYVYILLVGVVFIYILLVSVKGVNVWKYEDVRPRRNWSPGPGVSFGPIFSSSEKLKLAKDPKGPIFRGFLLLGQGVKIQRPKTPRDLIAGPRGFVWTYF